MNPDTTFTAGFTGGTTTIMAENSTLMLSDTFDIIIRDPTVDYIELTDAPGGTPFDIIEITMDEQLTIYASGYNNTGNTYIGLVEVDWTEDGALGSFDATPGTAVVYIATDSGITNITGVGTSLPVSDTFLMRIYGLAKEVDYIEITDAPNGLILTNVDLGVGEQIMVYASGYNDTTGYCGLVEVDWTFITGGTLGSLDNISGNSTTFTAGITDGLVEINGTNYYDPTKTDSFTVTILPPTSDFVLIRTATAGGGLDLTDPANYPSYPVGESATFYGAAYNNTSHYIGAVSETSTWVSDDINIVTTTSPGNQTTITCDDANYGTITLTLTDGLLSATTNITVLAPTVDYIEIRDAPGGAGSIVDTVAFNITDTDMFYAAGISNTVGYISDVSVNWTITPASGVGMVVAGPDDSTTFTAVSVGTCIVTATYSPTLSSSTGLLTVEDIGPVVNYILIRDVRGGSGNVVTTITYGVNDDDVFYAAAYDSGDNYIMDVEVAWSTSSSSVGAIDTTTGVATNFTAQKVSFDSICTITAEYDTSTSASTGDLTVLAPTVGEIRIVDTSSAGTTEIVDQNVIVGFEIIGYAASFNDTVGYLVDVLAFWDVNNTLGATASTFPTPGFSSEFDSEITGGIGTWTADDGNGHTDTVIFTIMPPTVDFIIIRDAPNAGGFMVTTDFFWGGDTVELYAAGYNNTAGFLYDVDVTWTCDDITVGQVTSPGNSTVFMAQRVTVTSTCTVTASYSTEITDSTGHITVNVVITEPDPPAKPTTLVKGSDSIQLIWTPNTEPNIAGYIVYRRESSNDQWIPVGIITDHDTSSYTDEGLEPDTKYYYVVTAVNDEGYESDPSPEVSAKTADEKGPSDVVKPGDDEVSLSDYWWLFLIIALVIISLIASLFLFRRQPPVIN
jgi:hypothetical protein